MTIKSNEAVTSAATDSDKTDREAGATKIFSAAEVASIELKDAPIPAAWVLTGAPHARAGALSSSVDGWATSVVWECTAGSFIWQFGWEETVFILEGSVRVIAETGEVRQLSAGDTAYFSQGTSAEWQIDSYVRKIAFMRNHVPSYVRKPLAQLQSLRNNMRDLVTTFVQQTVLRKLIAAVIGLGGSVAVVNMVFEM